MANVRQVITVTKAGVNFAAGTVLQVYKFRSLSIHGPYMAVGNAIDGTAGDFDPDFKALDPTLLRGTGERNGDTDDDRFLEYDADAAGDVAAFRLPPDHPTETAVVEILAPNPF